MLIDNNSGELPYNIYIFIQHNEEDNKRSLEI
jgi:GTPase Era involved in 16S rRNA processing